MSKVAQAILELLLSFAVAKSDAGMKRLEREEMLRPIAIAIEQATDSRLKRAFLVTQLRFESRMASCVILERCDQCPPSFGRCDNGKAIGGWQVWPWCKERSVGTKQERLVSQARCALKLWNQGIHDGGGRIECGFAAQGGKAGDCSRGITRARFMWWVYSKLRSATEVGK